ncbi:DUF86 domain-containing protein [Limnohabitans sp. MMS-10A-178]|uniref:HepT-like ribonuclease domain-containing protein n=1 Tax=Limnohabitans sp. MMS-10A-178 TaxID=1835767 RepID=UPI000D33513E|nr:DUF86 domain-containing protein [Limnohabitans sp. MMS-10A-178]PUE16479.1 hypothetical protein B9Z32_02445 [Limnohabitans sp. MMS-10A-178]
MMRDPKRLSDYLDHILEAIERIEEYVADLEEMSFLGNKLVQDAVIRNFEVIGEASNNIEKRFPEFVAAHPELPLASAYQMRNAVAHGYFQVDFEILWKTIRRDLPSLHTKVEEIRVKLTLGS